MIDYLRSTCITIYILLRNYSNVSESGLVLEIPPSIPLAVCVQQRILVSVGHRQRLLLVSAQKSELLMNLCLQSVAKKLA